MNWPPCQLNNVGLGYASIEVFINAPAALKRNSYGRNKDILMNYAGA